VSACAHDFDVIHQGHRLNSVEQVTPIVTAAVRTAVQDAIQTAIAGLLAQTLTASVPGAVCNLCGVPGVLIATVQLQPGGAPTTDVTLEVLQ
jgi:hypothetical protein